MVASAMGIFIPTAQRLDIIEAVVSRIAGYGFLDELLPPRRSDLIEIAINPDGSVWALRKSAQRFEPLPDVRPTPDEVFRALDAIPGPPRAVPCPRPRRMWTGAFPAPRTTRAAGG